MGQLQRVGPSQIRLQLLEDRTGRSGAALWTGVDTTMAPILGIDVARRYSSAVAAFIRDPGRKQERGNGPLENAAQALLFPLQPAHTSPDALNFQPGPEVRDQLRHLWQAEMIGRRLILDVLADDDRVTPGQAVQVSTVVSNSGERFESVAVRPDRHPEWVVQADSSGRFRIVDAGQTSTFPFQIVVPADQPPTMPYFMKYQRAGDLYVWPAEDSLSWGAPFEAPLASFEFQFTANWAGAYLRTVKEAANRTNNQAFGEVRRPLIVVPRVDVKLDPRTELWSTAPRTHDFTVTLMHGAKDSTRGTVALAVPAGWPAPEAQVFAFSREDEHDNFRFTLRPPANIQPGRYQISAVATDDRGNRYEQGVFTVDYPHIRPRSWTQRSTATITVAPLEMPRLRRVGYIRGAADRVPEALASTGLPIEMLDRSILERADLSAYDAIVVGSRAYETDSALVENNARLLAYARNGGLLIVQYQQQVFFNGRFAPFELKVGGEQIVLDPGGGTRIGPLIGHDRVTDETAPVRIIDPASAVVNRPNRIGPSDWEAWVQERGLYFARSWDEAFTPVLEMADPGEAPLRGGLLVARYGRGTYVYTGLSFFRELPAGVPGAFRLFANLLALGETTVP
jgi:hypothetical protein